MTEAEMLGTIGALAKQIDAQGKVITLIFEGLIEAGSINPIACAARLEKLQTELLPTHRELATDLIRHLLEQARRRSN